jgi:hypothetical protein
MVATLSGAPERTLPRARDEPCAGAWSIKQWWGRGMITAEQRDRLVDEHVIEHGCQGGTSHAEPGG